jgi:hypothetical protein
LAVRVRSVVEGTSAQKAARQLFSDDLDFDQINRAVSTQATLADPAWAGPLGMPVVSQAIEDIVAMSAIGRLLVSGALRVDLGQRASVTVPGRQTNASNVGTWVGEGGVVQVKQYSIPTAKLSPHKLEVLCTITFEQSQASNIAEILQRLLSESASLALDAALFASTAATPAQPGGLLHGLTPLTPSTASGIEGAGADLGSLVADIASRGGGARPLFIAAAAQSTSLRFWSGGQFGVTPANDILPITGSAALANGTLICIEPESVAVALSDLRFDVASGASLHMEDTTPGNIVSGTPSTPVKSMFQTDLLALKLSLLGADWGLRASHVSYMTGTSW